MGEQTPQFSMSANATSPSWRGSSSKFATKLRSKSATPLFTKTLWPGIGAAVEPGSGESFGSHRCRLTAEGIVDAWREGEQKTQARLVAIAKRFLGAGLDLTRPWLGPTGFDPFERPQSARLP